MFPPAQHEAGSSSRKAPGSSEDRCQPSGSGAFANGLLDLQEQRDRGFDLTLADHHHIVHKRFGMTCRMPARYGHRNALGDRGTARYETREVA